jgi:hypothetical protein
MDPKPAKPKADVAREERLAKALRDNLRRRKVATPKPTQEKPRPE